jgi:hypothetical protein
MLRELGKSRSNSNFRASLDGTEGQWKAGKVGTATVMTTQPGTHNPFGCHSFRLQEQQIATSG